MYEERNSFSIKKFILQALLVILFVLTMIWLFPTKDYMEETFVTEDELINRLQSIYGRNFASNIETMRDAAKDYFTAERLPKKVGDSITLTLKDMLDKKMVLEFVDSNGQKCSVSESYVTLTKMDTEYQLKVQLTCSDYADYIIDHIGCYDFCDTCDTVTTKPTTPSKKPEKDPTPVQKKYMYEYRLTTQNEYSAWSNWSEWSTKTATANTLTQVEQETRKEFSGYLYENKNVCTDKEHTVTVEEEYTDYEIKYETVYETEYYTEYVTKHRTVVTDTINATYNPGGYSEWKDAGTKVTYDEELASTDTINYTIKNISTSLKCEDSCKYVTVRVYTVKTRTYTQPSYSCPAGYTKEDTVCKKYTTEEYQEPITKSRQVPVVKEVKTEVIKTRKVPVTKTYKLCHIEVEQKPTYKDVTYYRFRTRTQTSYANTVYEWSNSKEDKTLLNKGYVLTGNKKEVK